MHISVLHSESPSELAIPEYFIQVHNNYYCNKIILLHRTNPFKLVNINVCMDKV